MWYGSAGGASLSTLLFPFLLLRSRNCDPRRHELHRILAPLSPFLRARVFGGFARCRLLGSFDNSRVNGRVRYYLGLGNG